MNKILITIALLFMNISLILSQITIKTESNVIINNNDVITINDSDKSHSLTTLITNSAAQPVELKLELIDVVGTNGDNMEFCFGLCFYGIQTKNAYPANDRFVLAANSTTTASEVHFEHHKSDSDAASVDYVFKVYELNNEQNNSIQFTYRYISGATAINDIEKESISVYPNPATSFIKIKGINFDKVEFMNEIGLRVKTVNKFEEIIPVNDLSKGIYFCEIYSGKKLLKTSKLIIK